MRMKRLRTQDIIVFLILAAMLVLPEPSDLLDGFLPIFEPLVMATYYYLFVPDKRAPITREKETTNREIVMIPCKHCGIFNPQNSTFCSSCGKKQV